MRRAISVKVLITKAIGSDDSALWEDYIPLALLEEKRAAAGGIIFGLQYQNDARLALGAVFNRTDFRFYERAPEDLAVYMGVDLAISASETADFFAIVTVGYSARRGEYYVLDAVRGRLSFKRQAETVVEAAKHWRPVRIGIESVAYQAALADFLLESGGLPIRRIHRKYDKVMRAWCVSALFEGGRVFMKRSDSPLADELAAFPNGEHDDLFDALETALSLARPGRTSGFQYIKGA